MNNLDTYARKCKDTTGDIKRVYLAKFVDYDETQIILTADTLTTFPSTVVYQFDVEGSYTQSTEEGAWKHEVNINLNTLYDELNTSSFTNQKFRLIAQTNNDTYLIFGLFNGLDCSLTNGSGEEKSAFNGFSLSFTGLEEKAASLVDIEDFTIYVNYEEVVIGGQTWMAYNLDINDGGSGIAYPNNNILNVPDYGLLYTYEAADRIANTIDGWRLPTEAETLSLATELGGYAIAGGKMKSIGVDYWQTPNTGADNTSGFNGRGAGYYTGFTHYSFKQDCLMWTSDFLSAGIKVRFILNYNNSNLILSSGSDVTHYLSLRLIKE